MNTSSYSLRSTTWEDFEFIFQLNKLNMRQYVELVRTWDDEAERVDMRRKFRPGRDQIIQLDGRDVGVFTVEDRGSELYLNHIELLPEYQGQGIGTHLIQSVLAEAKSLKKPVTLHVLKTNPARLLYERLGFETVEEISAGVDFNGMKRGVKCKMSTATKVTKS